jgi:hypothetical protein
VTASHTGVNTIATARCTSGQKVVSGGYVMNPPSATNANSPNFRDYAAGPGKWTAMSAFDSPPGNLLAFAYCTRGATVKVRSSSTSIAAKAPPPSKHPRVGSATARCHKGETLLAGGYTTTPKPDWKDTNGPDFFYNTSRRSGTRAWTASAATSARCPGSSRHSPTACPSGTR